MIIKAEYTPHYENDYAAASYESHAAFVKAADSFRTDYNDRFTYGYKFQNSGFNPLTDGEPDYPRGLYSMEQQRLSIQRIHRKCRVHRMTR